VLVSEGAELGKMNIIMMTENDPAGVAISFRNAINRFTDHNCRLITTASRYGFDYEKDIHLPNLNGGGYDEIEQLMKDADIFHFHILFDEERTLGPLKVKDYLKGKQIVHHHHGHPDFRSNPDKYCEKYRNSERSVFVSTPDLLKLIPFATWVPNPVPVDDAFFIPAEISQDGKVMLCQAPTRKDLKNTSEFIRVAKEIRREYDNVDYIIIENTRYHDCLLKKRECHIHFDHMQGYYGVSSLESLSQGRPVIAGLDDFNIEHIKRFTGSQTLPWIIARNTEALSVQIKQLVCDADEREGKGIESRTFMAERWSERNVLETLFDAYEKVPG